MNLAHRIALLEEAVWLAHAHAVTGGNIVSVANSAALTAFDNAGLADGALGFVATYGGYFSLQPAATLVPSVVLAAKDGRTWQRVFSAVRATSTTQTFWSVDPIAGNDENTGLPGFPVQHKAEISRRWGGWNAELSNVNVEIKYINPDVDNSDPGRFAPVLLNGATLLETADFPTATFIGTLNVVTAKNIPERQALTATVTSASGIVTAGMIFVNHSRGESRAVAVRDLGGGTWLLTQPLAPYTPNVFPIPEDQVEVDTWAHGDSISGFVPINVNIEIIGGNAMTSNPATSAPGHVVRQMTIWDPFSDFNACSVDAAATPFIVDCVFNRLFTGSGAAPATYPCVIQGCAHTVTVFCAAASDGAWQFLGGYVPTGIVSNGRLANNVIASSPDNVLFVQETNLDDSQIYIDTGVMQIVGGQCEFAGSSIQPKCYGTGTIDVNGGTCAYDRSGNTIFFCSMTIGGSPVAYSNVTDEETGITTTHRLALSGTALSAPAGATGFGELAFIPGVGAFAFIAAAP